MPGKVLAASPQPAHARLHSLSMRAYGPDLRLCAPEPRDRPPRARPCAGATAAHKRALREFRKRALGAASASDLIWDPLFEGMWEASEEGEEVLRGAY